MIVDNLVHFSRVLRRAGLQTKSGIMLGLGESFDEVVEAMDDLRSVDCQILTLGQYLQPTPQHLPIAEDDIISVVVKNDSDTTAMTASVLTLSGVGFMT